jgi:hypothetical protein
MFDQLEKLEVLLSKELLARVRAVYSLGYTDMPTLAATAIEKEVSRLENVKRKGNGNGRVGRPRLTAAEKEYRDQVSYIDDIYHSLEAQHGSAEFARIYGSQWTVYCQAVRLEDSATVKKFFDTCPWQEPLKFKQEEYES